MKINEIPKKGLTFEHNKLFVNLGDGSKIKVSCDCGGENFARKEGKFICLSCFNKEDAV